MQKVRLEAEHKLNQEREKWNERFEGLKGEEEKRRKGLEEQHKI